MSGVTLHLGDCIEVMRTLPDNSVDAIVTDPPYGLEFMGKEWDAPWKQTSGGFSAPGIGDRKTEWPSYKGSNRSRCATCNLLVGQGGSPCKCDRPKPILQDAARMHKFQEWCEQWAAESLRVLKPGGHLLAFSGSRTYHRMVCAIEDAGFEIRDQIMWVYGSGFPKSMDVSKAIDKAAGAKREVVGQKGGRYATPKQDFRGGQHHSGADTGKTAIFNEVTAPATDAARQWDGWGTALKPAHEPICVARKPLIGTVAANVLAYGTGAINIDACRVGTDGGTSRGENGSNAGKARNVLHGGNFGIEKLDAGRWPANLIHDGSDEVIDTFPTTTSVGHTPAARGNGGISTSGHAGQKDVNERHHDSGSAARFFYCAKASRKDRGEGNGHPTVKPTDLMAYLVRLVTPPGGVVLDPFMGSGSTGKACVREGFGFIGIELSPEYLAIAEARIAHEQERIAASVPPQADLFTEPA